jgi:hypothetical protein
MKKPFLKCNEDSTAVFRLRLTPLIDPSRQQQSVSSDQLVWKLDSDDDRWRREGS